ncbi:MAG: type II toxin-antitoxin system HicA family toxin [Candidatus Sigynarchaeota archaeon]
MTPKLPPVSGDQAIKVFLKLGYETVHQKGSHVRLKHPSDVQRRPLTVPLHKELKIGLLRRLLNDANLSHDEFLGLL